VASGSNALHAQGQDTMATGGGLVDAHHERKQGVHTICWPGNRDGAVESRRDMQLCSPAQQVNANESAVGWKAHASESLLGIHKHAELHSSRCCKKRSQH
jgi:hypothetical protein